MINYIYNHMKIIMIIIILILTKLVNLMLWFNDFKP
jgi:hypothetical protein